MKTKNTNTRKNKFLRIGASGLLLAILFVFVFAGVLTASFAVERKAVETGQIEANVADASDNRNGIQIDFNNPVTTDGVQLVLANMAASSNPERYAGYYKEENTSSIPAPDESSYTSYFFKNCEEDNNANDNFTYSYELNAYQRGEKYKNGGLFSSAKYWYHYSYTPYGYGYRDRNNSGFGSNSDRAFIWWLEFDFSDNPYLLEAINNGNIGFIATSTGWSEKSTFMGIGNGRDQYSMAISYIGIHNSPTAEGIVSGSRDNSDAAWSDGIVVPDSPSALLAYGATWVTTDTERQNFRIASGNTNNYAGSYVLPAGATGIRMIFAAITENDLDTCFYNLSLKLYLNPNIKIDLRTNPSAGGTISVVDQDSNAVTPSGTLYQFTSTHQTFTATATTNNGYHFNGWDDGETEKVRTFNCWDTKPYDATDQPNRYIAQYGKNSGQIIFHPNDGVDGASVVRWNLVENIDYDWDTGVLPLPNGGNSQDNTHIYRPGYIFRGWSTNSSSTSATYVPEGGLNNSTTHSQNEASVFNLRAEDSDGKVTHLYAIWTQIGFKFYHNSSTLTTYSNYTNQPLRISQANAQTLNAQGKDCLVQLDPPSGYTWTKTYYNSDWSSFVGTRPTTEGSYNATIIVKDSSGSQIERGRLSIQFTIAISDFGTLSSGTSGTWGSATNPYVIAKPIHLSNLALIVNGASPLDSEPGDGKHFAGKYFLLAPQAGNSYTIVTGQTLDMSGLGGLFNGAGNNTSNYFAGTFDGHGNTISIYFSNADNSYVGIFGHTNGANIHDLTVTPTILSGDRQKIKGRDYVGGIVGCAENTTISNCSVETYVDASGSWIGGVIGKGTNVTIQNVKNDTASGISDKSSSANLLAGSSVIGGQYVGGIAGELIGSTYDTLTLTMANVYGNSYVGGYVGKFSTTSETTFVNTGNLGYAPMLRTDTEIVDGAYVPDSMEDSASSVVVVAGAEFVGSIFGYVETSTASRIFIKKRTSDGGTAVNYQYINACVVGNGNGRVVGGVVGYAKNVSIVVTTTELGTRQFFRFSNSNDRFVNVGGYTSFFGGIVGVLGEDANIISGGSDLGGAVQTIVANTEVFLKTETVDGIQVPRNGSDSYIGGIVGYISPKAGKYVSATEYVFGNDLKLVNKKTITAVGNYVGGLVGYIGVEYDGMVENYALVDFLPTEIVNDRVARSGVTLNFAPRFDAGNDNSIKVVGTAQNTANVIGGSYVGGIVGCVAYSSATTEGARVQFNNATLDNDSITMSTMAVFNAEITAGDALGDNISVVGTADYVGGIAGAIVGARNTSLIQNVFVTATTAAYDISGISGHSNVGGVVGRLDNGKIYNCFFARVNYLDGAPYTQARILGESNTGGFIGVMYGGEIKDCVGIGFLHSNCGDTNSGVVGSVQGGSALIQDSWQIYYVANNNYYNSVDDSRGKGIIVGIELYDDDPQEEGDLVPTGVIIPTYQEIGLMVGVFGSIVSTKSATLKKEGSAGYVSVALSFPFENSHIVVYDASGAYQTYDMSNFASGNFGNFNEVMCFKIAKDKPSFSICIRDIKFKNIPKKVGSNDMSDDNVQNFKDHFFKPASDTNYIVIVDNLSYGSNSYASTADGHIELSNVNVGDYDFTFVTGDEATPYLIEDEDDWYQFAANIRYNTYNGFSPSYSGTTREAYSQSHFRLTNDLDLETIVYQQLAGDGRLDTYADQYAFKGTFDGDGHTIKFTFNTTGSNAKRASLFPNASDAVFKNLTLEGSINVVGSVGTTTSGKYEGSDNTNKHYSSAGNAPYSLTSTQLYGVNIAGFVGQPYGDVTFVNCTNKVNIEAAYDAGGFVGYATDDLKVTIIDCVNDGNITTYGAGRPFGSKEPLSASDVNVNWNHGTGGFIGDLEGNATLDSCKNTGTIKAGQNVGGIVGRVTKSLSIYNCANTGNITAHSGYNRESVMTSNAKEQAGTRNWLNYAGGIVGKTSRQSSSVSAATLKLYASYNTGEIVAYGNVAGGLVGGIGDLYPVIRGIPKETQDRWPAAGSWIIGLIAGQDVAADSTSANGESVIAYCYNEGKVYTGGKSKKRAEAWGGDQVAFLQGTIAGGIVGIFGGGTVSYCYNTGDITSNGIDGFSFEWHVRVGGIVGQAQPYPNDAYIHHCYNIGAITSTVNTEYSGSFLASFDNNSVLYGGGILGYIEDPTYTLSKEKTHVYDCYSLKDKYSNANYNSDVSSATGIAFNHYQQGKDANEHTASFDAIVTTITYVYPVYGVHNCSSGVVVTLDELTSIMDLNTTTYESYVAPKGDTITNILGQSELTGFAEGGTSYDVSNGKNGSHETIGKTPRANQPLTNSGNGIESGAGTLVNQDGTDIKSFNEETYTVTYNSANFLSGDAFGWVYIPGCLPQLAVFTLGTKKGMSMLATSYGINSDGEYEAQQAGGKYSPYLVKDGIHLLGMSAITSASKDDIFYSFRNKYIEAAHAEYVEDPNNSGKYLVVNSNNIDGYNLEKITLPTSLPNTINETNLKSNHVYYGYGQIYDKSTKTYSDGYFTTKSYSIFSKSAVYKTAWNNKNYYYSGTAFAKGTGIGSSNFHPIGGVGDHAVFRGNFDGKGLIVEDLNLLWATSGSHDIGLFGRTQDATIKSVTVTGYVKGYTLNSTSNLEFVAAGGIVGVAGAGTTIEGCKAGTNDKKLTVQAFAPSDIPNGYVGGIVGMISTLGFQKGYITPQAVSAAKVYVRNCTVQNADIFTFKSGAGGIAGRVLAKLGDTRGAGTSVYIDRCSVLGAAIQTTADATGDANVDELGTNAGGVVGSMDNYVNLTIQNTNVGAVTKTTTAQGTNVDPFKVTIKGENSIGGIIGVAGKNLTIQGIDYQTVVNNAQTTINGVTGVYGDVLIQRASWGTAVKNATTYGTAMGGLIGYTPNEADGTPANVLGGRLLFAGKIDMNNIPTANSGYVESVGGVAGYIGAGTRFAAGATIYIVGAINTTGNSIVNAKNIGGVTGSVYDAAFAGTFYVAPSLTASNATNVGGFIGAADNKCTILSNGANKTEINIGGVINAKQYVGGFIGYIALNGTLEIGPESYAGEHIYTGAIEIKIDDVLSFTVPGAVSATTAPATVISATTSDVGGIVGANIGGSSKGIIIHKGTIKNEGTVTKAENSSTNNVGGVIGNNNGALSIASTATISNGGNVIGNDQVGGIIGFMQSGTLSGQYTNGELINDVTKGNVTGVQYVGGIIGRVTGGTVGGELTNIGTVVATGSYAGGSIGSMESAITGTSVNRVEFINSGTVSGVNYLGGNIGSMSGTATYINFVNSGAVTSTGNTRIGGSIGSISGDYSNSHAEYTSSSGLTVTGNSENANSVGGVGGVIGVIENAATWGSNNTFYVAGNVLAKTENTSVNDVGGSIGLIDKSNITIANLLAYDTYVTGGNNVGGIVGRVNKASVTISNSFNVTIDSSKGVLGTSNVGGIVGKAYIDANDKTNGTTNSTDAHTSYWVKGYKNNEVSSLSMETLQANLGKYLVITKTISGVTYALTKDFCQTRTPYQFDSSIGVANKNMTWESYLTNTTYCPLPTGYTTVDNGGGWWMYSRGNSFQPFTTGTANTGWYFLYSDDFTERVGNQDVNLIRTQYVDSGNIAYWKYIANNYSAQESRWGDNSTHTSGIICTTTPSYNGGGDITATANQDTIHAVASGSNVSGYYLYIASSATPGEGEDGGLTTILTSNDSGSNVRKTSVHVFIQAKTDGSSENVVVYYRSVGSGLSLTYNGYQRYAPLSIEESELAFAYDNTAAQAVANRYVYTTTLVSGNDTRASAENANNAPNVSDVAIYYVYGTGTPLMYQVGYIDDMEWEILQANLTATITANGSFYGTVGSYKGNGTADGLSLTELNKLDNGVNTIVVEITGVRASDTSNNSAYVGFDFELANIGATGNTGSFKTPNVKSRNLGITQYANVWVTYGNSLTGDTPKLVDSVAFEDTSESSNTINAEEKHLYSYTYKFVFHFTNADSGYQISDLALLIDGSANNREGSYILNIPANPTLTISSIALTTEVVGSATDFVYTGGTGDSSHYKTFYIGKAGTGTDWYEQVDISTYLTQFGVSIIYDNGTAIDEKKFTSFSSITNPTLASGATVAVSGSKSAAGYLLRLFNVLNKGDYYLHFDRLTLDSTKNYTIAENPSFTSVEGKGSYNLKLCSVKENKIFVDWSVSSDSDLTSIYNPTQFGQVTLRFTTADSVDALANLSSTVQAMFGITCNDATVQYPLPNSSAAKSVTYVLQTSSKNADTYEFVVSLDTENANVGCEFKTGSYWDVNSEDLTSTITYTIETYKIKVAIAASGGAIKYDGQPHVPGITITKGAGMPGTISADNANAMFTYNSEDQYVTLDYNGSDVMVNVGTYLVTPILNSSNYELTADSTTKTWRIVALDLVVTGWSTPVSFVFNEGEHAPHVTTIKIDGNTVNGSFNSSTKTTTFAGVSGNEQIKIVTTGYNINQGNYNASTSASNYTVSGNNDASVATVKGNYKFITDSNDDSDLKLTCNYTILPSIVSVEFSTLIDKTYDGTDATTKNPSNPTISSTNGGATNCTVTFSNGTYDTANYGNGKTVTFNVQLTNNNLGNYSLYESTVSSNTGRISKAVLTISLNTRGGAIYKTYDGTTTFGEWDGSYESGDSTNYISGCGFTVSGMFAADASATALTVEADIVESGNGRSEFNAFVNNATKSGDVYYIDDNGTNKKKLTFTIGGTSAGNYKYEVKNGATTIKGLIESASFDIYDSNAPSGYQTGYVSITVEKRSIDATYTHTRQSYITADNKFNTVWQNVGLNTLTDVAENDTARLGVNVENGWQVDSTTGEPKVYKKHQIIYGEENSSELSGALVDKDGTGKHVNYILRNQPVLTIGYFVSDQGEAYKIASISGLMLATYYYSRGFVEQDESVANPTIMENKWHRIVSNADYVLNTGCTEKVSYARDLEDYDPSEFANWSVHFTWLEGHYTHNGRSIKIIYDPTENGGEWGFWGLEPDARSKTYYYDFVQTKNFSGIYDETDIAVLQGLVGEGNWADYFPNFLPAKLGSTVVAIGSIFRNQSGKPFFGKYDGKGYTINNVIIVGYADSAVAKTYNIGMFESIGSGVFKAGGTNYDGKVTNVNLRNWSISFADYNSISGDNINIGGIVGLSQQVFTHANSTFHGTITVSGAEGTINVGGLIGKYDNSGISQHKSSNIVVSGAISVGEIFVNGVNVNAGGVIGNFAASDYTVYDVVAMMAISAYATGTGKLGGLIGTSTNSDVLQNTGENETAKENTFVTDSVINMTSTPTAINKKVGDGENSGDNISSVDYSTLMSSENTESGYTVSNTIQGQTYHEYHGLGYTSTPKKYDVIAENAITPVASFESMRLVDIIKVYVLLYPIDNTSTAEIGEAGETITAHVYKMAESSWLVGDKLGTNSSKLAIYNIQQATYIAEFRFASIIVVQGVTMYTAYNRGLLAGCFYGTLTDASKLVLRNQIMTITEYNARYGNDGTTYAGSDIEPLQTGIMFDEHGHIVVVNDDYALIDFANPSWSGAKYKYNSATSSFVRDDENGLYLKKSSLIQLI